MKKMLCPLFCLLFTLVSSVSHASIILEFDGYSHLFSHQNDFYAPDVIQSRIIVNIDESTFTRSHYVEVSLQEYDILGFKYKIEGLTIPKILEHINDFPVVVGGLFLDVSFLDNGYINGYPVYLGDKKNSLNLQGGTYNTEYDPSFVYRFDIFLARYFNKQNDIQYATAEGMLNFFHNKLNIEGEFSGEESYEDIAYPRKATIYRSSYTLRSMQTSVPTPEPASALLFLAGGIILFYLWKKRTTC